MTKIFRKLLPIVAVTIVAAGPSAPLARAAVEDPGRAAGVEAGWVPLKPRLHAAWMTWSVAGRLDGREGNRHVVSVSSSTTFARQQASDEQLASMTVEFTDYHCSPGVSDPSRCRQIDTTQLATESASIAPVGLVGMNTEAVLTDGQGRRYPVRLELRPTGHIFSSVDWADSWDADQVTARGRIGPVDVADSGVRTQHARLEAEQDFTWTGPGTPPLRTGATSRPPETLGKRWHLNEDWRHASVSWLRMGQVPDRPGNAHSGFTSASRSVDAWIGPPVRPEFSLDVAEWNDWSCPRGVRPPVRALRFSPCTLLRTEHDRPAGALTWFGAAAAAFGMSGPVGTQVQTPAGLSRGTQRLDLTFRPGGHSHSWLVHNDPSFFLIDAVAETRASGHVGWVDLAAPTEVREGAFYSYKSFTRGPPASRPGPTVD